jgi:hypothetical protein
VFPANELVRFVDSKVSRGAFARLVRAHVEGSAFPDLAEAYRALGIEVQGRKVVLRDEGAPLRRAIAGPRGP